MMHIFSFKDLNENLRCAEIEYHMDWGRRLSPFLKSYTIILGSKDPERI